MAYISAGTPTLQAGSAVLRYAPSSYAAFTVSLNSASATPVTVNYSTADGTAVAGSDYIAASGTLTFAPGVTTKTIVVPTLVDNVGGPTPVFTLNLSNAVGAIIAKGQGVATIVDDDVTPVNIAVTPPNIPSGGTATVTLTAKDGAGNPLPGLPFNFGWFAYPGSGSFSSVTDNHDGTYTATFTGTTVGVTSATTIIATLFGQTIASNQPIINVTPAVPAAQLAITSLSPTSVAAGGTVSFTVIAEDSAGAPVPSYAGTVHFTSSDPSAVVSGDYTFTSADNGKHTFTVMLQSAGTETITVTDQANSLTATTSPVTVSSGPATLLVKLPGGNTTVAGNPFLFTLQAVDASGNPVTSYSGPTSVEAAIASPPDPQATSRSTSTPNGSGFGLVPGKSEARLVLTRSPPRPVPSRSTERAASPSLPLSDASCFTITAPAAATTGSPFNVTVTAFDHFGNVATGYTGTIKLTSTDPAALAGSYTFTSGAGKDNGVHTFSATLKTGGSQTITATDTSSTNPAITGSSSAITTRGLTVTAFTPTATGFTVTFSKPIVAADVFLYGGTVASPIQNVTLAGTSSGPVTGTFVIDPSGASATFKASSTYLQTFFQESVLPNDTWKATLASGTGTGATANGFFDALGAALDGANNAGYVNHFDHVHDNERRQDRL